eukprot:gene8537-11539_t
MRNICAFVAAVVAVNSLVVQSLTNVTTEFNLRRNTNKINVQAGNTVYITSLDTDNYHTQVYDTYLSFCLLLQNIPTINYGNAFFTQLTKNLFMGGSTELRLGGAGSSDFLFTRGNGCPSTVNGVTYTACVTAAQFDAVALYAKKIGAGLVYDFNIRQRLPDGSWDTTNTELLMDYMIEKGYALTGVELGNEMELFIRQYGADLSGYQAGQDMVKLKQLLQSPKYKGSIVDKPIYGPQYCCDKSPNKNGQFIKDFTSQSKDVLGGLTVQHYPIHVCEQVRYYQKAYWDSSDFLDLTSGFMKAGAGSGRVPPFIMSEIGNAFAAGCPGLSDVFVAGFSYMYQLGITAKSNVVQLFRQDIYGGNYELVNVTNWWGTASFSIAPDYYVSILWKQLIGNRVLRSEYFDDPDFDVNVWCASGAWGGTKGAPVLTYTSTRNIATNINTPFTVSNRVEYIYTSSAVQTTASAPPSLFRKNIFLNGVLMSVKSDGSLPVFPFQGVKKTDTSITVPPYSFGFIVLEGMGAINACTR